MDTHHRMGPRKWATTSPEHLDRLALGLLRVARDAARELRRNAPGLARQTWALGKLAGRNSGDAGPGAVRPPARWGWSAGRLRP
jgi:hypothetical protein